MARHKRAAAEQGAWLVLEDESRQGLRSPRAAPGEAGWIPVVTATGGSNKRVSVTALMAVKAGQRPRLVFRVNDGRRHRAGQAQGLH